MNKSHLLFIRLWGGLLIMEQGHTTSSMHEHDRSIKMMDKRQKRWLHKLLMIRSGSLYARD